MIRFGSVCSGIEAASVAWHPLGWRAAWLAEIEPFPSAVLAHHYPDVPNLGDMTKLAAMISAGAIEAPDVFCGGTPCQAFSVAGLRRSLDDARGNLSLVFCEIANAIDAVRLVRGEQPATIFWEMVPGVLSTKDKAFGCFLAGLAGEDEAIVPEHRPADGKSSRYWRWNKAAGDHSLSWPVAGCIAGPTRAVAWRVLDAQYFGVAQRRRRVFVVASARNGFDPAAVLFEFDGVRRDTAPSREAREVAAQRAAAGAGGSRHNSHWNGGVHPPLSQAAQTRAGGPSASSHNQVSGQMSDAYMVPMAFDTTQITSATNRCNPQPGDPCHPLAAGAHAPAIAFPANLSGTQCASAENVSPSLGALNPTGVAYTTKLHNTGSNNAGKISEERTTCLDANSPPPALLTAMQVRRLTPRECERLQGFPDDYTLIPWKAHQAWAKKKGTHADGKSFEDWLIETTGRGLRQPTTQDCPDGPRYKALGNSWAVPNVRWIGERIAAHLQSIAANDNKEA